ncbi:glycosyltransferase [Arthrobacter sp. H20]|uniref:glycosyltransferase n=1 Tax=Arthrobacter sp. H20 TaxID=1267981 RepID=UPI0020A6A77C|nr:glycosyltransferase [Arthrobacter sp. H20]
MTPSIPATSTNTNLFDAPSGALLTPAPEDPAPQNVAPNRGDPDINSTDTSTVGLLPDWSVGEWLAYGSLMLVAVLLTAIAVTTLWWMLHAWRSRDSLQRTGFAKIPRPAAYSFSLLVPGRHEEEVMGQTLDKLAEQDHPDFEIIAIVGHDDPGTEAVARAAAARHPELIKVVVDDSVPKNKPKALNLALKTARGSVVGVFDAEDDVHPRLLSLVDSRFTETSADVVQGGVQLMNFDTTWWSLRNVLEYYFWFRSRLHFHANAKFIPLGGNTVFIKRTWLDWSNGWDAECLAEDCEVGVRLSSQGATVAVAYSPEVVTREETPGTLKSLFKQRTRWNQGFLQVLGKGEWRKLPSARQRLFARYILAMPFLQAATGLLIPVSIVLILTAKVPVGVALITFLPLGPTIVTLAAEAAGLHEFGKLYGRKVRMRDYVRLVLGTFPYQVFLAAAAVRAVWRQIRGENSWEKTEHTGAHRTDFAPLPGKEPQLVGAGHGSGFAKEPQFSGSAGSGAAS